jgi:hypothetical protein
VIVAVPLVLLAKSARADGNGDVSLHSRLVYSAPRGCPDETRFRAQLAQHSEVAIGDEGPITLVVEVQRENDKTYRGRVSLIAREKKQGVREVVGMRCDDVVRGLTLFSAMALDAYMERRAKEPATPEPPAPSAPPPPPTPPTPPRRTSRVELERAPPPKPWLFLGAGLGQQNAVRSRPVYYVDAFVEAELEHTYRPSVRLGAQLGSVVPQTYLNGTLLFGLGRFRLDACPARAMLGRSVLVGLCAAGDAGWQFAALQKPGVGQSLVRSWLSVGGVGRIRAHFTRGIDIELSVGAFAPLRTFDFLTQSGVAYSTPPLAPEVQLNAVFPIF